MQLIELRNHLDTLLDAQRLKDYCPNGLQVEGRPEVARVLCGVTASQALLDRAVAGGQRQRQQQRGQELARHIAAHLDRRG